MKFLLKEKDKKHRAIKRFLKSNSECYVLLMCSKPKDGNMQVEMSYDGDEILASYLLENALVVLQKK